MKAKTALPVEEVLGQLRSELKLKRGYGSRVAKKLRVPLSSVYNVSWGRVKDARILKALMEEAKHGEAPTAEYYDVLSTYQTAA